MSRLLLFSDLHLRPETEDVCFQVLEDIHGFISSPSSSFDAVAFLGDFWHMRYQVPVHLVNRVSEWVSKMVAALGPKGLIFLPGNHDQINVVGENAMEVFQAHGARVYSTPTHDEWGGWMPYRKDPETVKEGLNWLRQNAARKVLFAHLPVRGALMNNLIVDEHGLPTTVFKGWQRVILGHYHKRQEWMNGAMCYVGSPWQTRSDEWGQDKGYAVWDESINQLQFVNMHWGPRHHRLDFETWGLFEAWVQDSGPSVIEPQDLVKISLPTQSETKAAADWIKSSRGVQKVIQEAKDVVVSQPRFAFKKGTTLTEYAHQYVLDKKPKELDQKTLMYLWGHITGDA